MLNLMFPTKQAKSQW